MKNIDPHLHDSGFLDDDSEEDNKNIDIKDFVSGEVKKIEKNSENNINNK